jgi:hypothetical protein
VADKKRTPKLHEILAVEPDAKAQTNKVLAETERIFKNPKDYILGETVVVENILEDEPPHDGSEKLIVTTVPARTKYTLDAIAKEAKVSASKAATNAVATADVILPGGATITDMPAEVIMKMIDKLKQVRSVLNAQPTLDNRTKWSIDDNRDDVFVAPTTSVIGTRKVQSFEVVVKPTEFHPAEIRDVSKDIPARRTLKTVSSGAIPSTVKAAQLKKCDQCIEAFKRALERANGTEVVDVRDFEKVLEIIQAAGQPE